MASTLMLPIEIIFQIISSLIDAPGTIYSPSHPVTKTLLSFTLVCRATHAFASNHLRRQCFFIEDRKRLADCVAYLQATNHLVPEYQATQTEGTRAANIRLCPITSLYLAPIASDLTPRQTLDDIIQLCSLTRTSLSRLIIDMPWQFACEPDVSGYTDALSTAFSSLSELRDVVNLANYYAPNHSVVVPSIPYEYLKAFVPALTKWPNLRRLAVLDGVPTGTLWADLCGLAALETFIFAKSSHPAYAWLKSHLDAARLEGTAAGVTMPHRPLKIVVAAQPQPPETRDRNVQIRLRMAGAKATLDPDNLISFVVHDYWPPAPTKLARESFECVRAAALQDEIWEWDGEPM